jgi:hypothetical protein
MTASLLAVVAIALLALISGVCFVGCVLNTHGTGTGDPKPTTFTKYSDVDVLADPHCVAYWPLDDASPADGSGKITARDAKGGQDGAYKHKGNAATLFPCPAYEASPGVNSAQANGFLSLGMESLLPGDAKQPANDPAVLTTGAQVDGAFVTVPLSAVINPPGPFTIEAWARPEWSDGGPPTLHVLIDARGNVDGAFGGYGIWVNPEGNWEGVIVGTGPTNAKVTAGKAALQTATHVALVFDGVNVTLFVNAVASPSNALPAGQVFSANTKVPLIIGVGSPSLPTRTQPGDLNFFPLFPFKGTIQCVALYNAALTPDVIKKHFDDGSGKTTLPAG